MGTNWHKIKNGAPRDDELVLVWTGRTVDAYALLYWDQEDQCFCSEDGWEEEEAEYWMRLPNPPTI